MAKKFLTNINLAGNQLLNAAIQPSASAPSALSAGQLYYNTNDGIFYFSTGTGTGNWEPVGVQYVKSVSGNLSVDGNGILSLDEAGLANDLASGSNFITNSGVQLNINLSSLESQLVADGFYTSSDLPANYITAVDGNVFNVDSGTLQLNSVVSAPGTEVHITKLELHLGDDENRGVVLAHPSDGSLTVAAINELHLESHNGNITLTPDSIVLVNGSLQTANGYNITSGNNLYVKNGIYAGGIDTATDGSLNIQDASGNNIVALGGTAGAGIIETHGVINLYRPYNDGGTQYGSIYTDGSTDLLINASNGSLVLSGDSNQIIANSTIVANDGIQLGTLGGYAAYEIINQNTDLQLDSENNLILRAWAPMAEVQIASGSGVTTFSVSNPDDNVTPAPIDSSVNITTDNTNVTLNAGGSVVLGGTAQYLNSVAASNQIATVGDIHAAQAGLSVKDSVKFLSTDNVLTLGNYGFNSDISSVVVGDRVLFINQTNASDNGIYTVTENQGSEGAVTRAADQNTPKEGDFVFVEEGEYAGQGWIAQADLTWAQFSAAGEYTFNGGLHISGTTVSVNYTSLESQLVSDDFAKNADYSTVTRKYASSITGNSTDSTFSFTHGLNSRDVVVRVYQTSSGADQYNDIEVDVTRTSANAVSVSFASAPATGETYAVVVVG